MQHLNISTDNDLKSTLSYGTKEFPFTAFRDAVEAYKDRYVEAHWHREFQFSAVVRGNVIYRIGGTGLHLSAGDIIFVNSGVIHRCDTENSGLKDNILFSPEFGAVPGSTVYEKYVEPFLTSDLEYRVFPRNKPATAAVSVIVGRICGMFDSNDSLRELKLLTLVSSLWELLLADAENIVKRATSQKNRMVNIRLQKMIEYIHSHYSEHIHLEDIAAAANVSQSEAIRCFRAGIQTSPVNYLNDYRLLQARERLVSSNETVTSVAFSSGFESPGYFSRVFKEKFGCTPNDYRKNAARRIL